jgi:hypothetical protein
MIPHPDEFEQMIFDVFNPRIDDHIAIVFDTPTDGIADNELWADRRILAMEWFNFFSDLSKKIGFTVDIISFDGTGVHNKLLSDDVLNDLSKFNLVIALTEFSVTSSLASLIASYPDSIRCASMPGAERRMHDSVFIMDYKEVYRYAHGLKGLLDSAISANVVFSTLDELFIDLRYRNAGVDAGDCTQFGSLINFPSGEGFIVPYEGTSNEIKQLGLSKTAGIIPFMYQDELIKAKVFQNKFIDFSGSFQRVSLLRSYFNEFSCRRNIAEFGIGCNQKAVVTGNMFEDEKAGVHIAYGSSKHLGGKISCDVHFDLVFAKSCPVVAEKVTLHLKNDSSVDLVEDGMLRYDILS